MAHSFCILGKFVAVISSIFLMPFLFIFFFWDTYDLNVGAFNIAPEVSEVVLISFLSSFFLSASFISTILSSTSHILSSASVILLLVLSKVLLISVTALLLLIHSSLFLLGHC